MHLYVQCYQPNTEVWTVFPPEGMPIGIRERPESPLNILLHKVQPGPVPKYRFFYLSARDTVCPSGCDVLRS